MKHKIITILCLLGCTFGAATAQNIVHPKIAGPNGLWVNSFNGVLFFGQTDMETQNTAMPMELCFYYNSSSYATNYGYGLGFSLGYEMRYSVDDAGNVTIEQGDGRGDTYKCYGTDYEAPAGVFSVLTKGDDGSYILTQRDGTVYTFGNTHHHKLTAITDRNGNKTELTYTDSLLTQIKDAVGHTIILGYTNGLLTQASASFHQGSIKYEYNSKNCLRKRTDAMGNSTVYAYDDNNRLEAITDANGHKTMIAYNSAGMCSRLKTDVSDKSIRYDGDKTVFVDYTEPKNQYSYYRWDEKGRVIEKVGLCCGIQSTLEYDDDDNVVKRTDANGNVTSYTYDDRGNMLSLTDALGNTERYTYDTDFNQVTSFSDKNGNSYSFTYDNKGNLTALNGPAGYTNAFTYNDKGWPLTTTDANGNVTATTYNADGTISNVMNAAGHTTAYAYDQCGNITTVTDPRGNSTSYKYDDNNRMVSQTDALGNTTTVSYDKVGNIVRVLDAKNQITAYTYDAQGNVLSMMDAKGGTYTFTYDGKGNIVSVTDPVGVQQTLSWNEKNKIQSHTNGEGERITYDYDAKGNLTTIVKPNGNVMNFFYDQVDRITQVSDNIGTILKYTYDANGNRLTATDGLERTKTFTYDALNRRVSETLPSGATTHYSYDGNGNLLLVTDAKGSTTGYTFTSLNQQLTHTNALGAETKYEYDANGNLIKVTDAKNYSTIFTYDALNRNTDISFANGAMLQYGYDELGRVITTKDRVGIQVKYAYDVMGNLVTKTFLDGSVNKYTYDGNSRMLSAVNADATVNFTYDRAGRVLSETLTPLGESGGTVSYTYDVAAGKRALTYPSGMNIVEQLNARNLITSILQNGNEVVAMSYNAAGQKTQQTFANGIITDYSYNDNGWLASVVTDHDIVNLQIAYDVIGNITQRKDMLDEALTENYDYDAISQLISFTRGTTVNKEYQFDILGNRVKMLENGVATTYTSNNVNAYTAITGPQSFTPEYDENGSLLRDADNKFAYGYNSKLSLAGTTEYKYDALGRRVKKDNKTYYYDGSQMIEETIDEHITSYVNGNSIDEVITRSQADEKLFYSTNNVGSTIVLSDANGTIVERVQYDAFGNPHFSGENPDVSSVGNSILFTGREYDAETGNYYYRSRYYSPKLGRFMQKDKLMYVDGMNDYMYARNNPALYIDVAGERPTTKEAAEMAEHVYGEGRTLSGGWTRCDLDIEGVRYRSDGFRPSSGFNSGLYQRVKENGQIEFAYVTQGTNSGVDWLANGQQALGWGFLPGQYRLSMNNAKKLSEILSDCELTFVGHSLGGGMASANAVVTGNHAITFNPAGLAGNTISLHSWNPWEDLKAIGRYVTSDKLVEVHIIEGEILNKVNWINPLTGPGLGKRYYHEGTGGSFGRHSMNQFTSKTGL